MGALPLCGSGRIPHLGEMHVSFITQERRTCRRASQATKVKRPLLAVHTLTRTGNVVSFSTEGGAVTNRRAGRKISFT